MKNLKAYWRIFAAAMREDLSNPRRMVAAAIQQLVRVLLIVAIYHVAYSVSGSQILSFTNAMWTIGISFAFFLSLGMRNIFINVEHDIKTGAVETGLINPLDWRIVKIAQHQGKMMPEFLLMIVMVPITLWLLIGLPDTSHLNPWAVALFAVFFCMSVVTACLLFLMVGMAAFWLNDSRSVFRIIDKMALIFCGTFVPIALLPEIIQQITYFTPFAIYAAPTRLFDPFAMNVLWPMLMSGLAWMGIMSVACQIMWRRANHKIEVNGG
jgi:ABC-2 type transport system permease protein